MPIGEIWYAANGAFPSRVLEPIMQEIAAAFKDKHGKVACEGGKLKLYVAPGTPHLVRMKELGLVGREPARKAIRRHDSKRCPAGEHYFMQKAWSWLYLYLQL